MICPISLPLRTCPILMLTFFAFAALPARAQDASTQERLDRLERDLSMLQRQIYGAGEGAGAFPGSGNIAVNTQVRMDRLEQEMRDLTGKVENETNQVEQLRQRLEQINSDIEVRFGQLGQAPGSPSGQGSTSPPPRPPRHAQAFAPPPNPEPPAIDNRPPPPPTNPPPYFADGGTLTPPPLPPPAPTPDAFARTPPDMPPPPTRLTPSRTDVAAAGSLRPPGPGVLPGGSTLDQYNSAFGLVRQANYPAAEEALRNFVADHPGHPLAGNAQYWLGEVYLKRGRYAEAAAAFAEGYKRYPKGAKAPEQLLGLASALGRENQKQNACVALGQLDHDFPHPGSAVREKSAAEKKRLGC